MDNEGLTYDEATLQNILTFQLIQNDLQEEILVQNETIIGNQEILIESIDNGFIGLYLILLVILGFKLAVDFIKGVFRFG